MSRIFELLRQSKLDAELLQKPVAQTATTNSRNFELLQQAQKDELLFEDVKSTDCPSETRAGRSCHMPAAARS